jgi:hypothetical protein
MKRLFLLMTFSVSVYANAQLANVNSKVSDNVAVGLTAGALTPIDFNHSFPLNANAGLLITKDISPTFGFQIEGLAIFNDNRFGSNKTLVKATNVGLNGGINLNNLFGGYRGVLRQFELKIITGLGWLHIWNYSTNFATAKTGLDFMYNLGKKKEHSFVITPAIYWNLNKYGEIKFHRRGAQLGLNFSYLYHLRTSNGTHHFKTYDVGALLDVIQRLNKEAIKAQELKNE